VLPLKMRAAYKGRYYPVSSVDIGKQTATIHPFKSNPRRKVVVPIYECDRATGVIDANGIELYTGDRVFAPTHPKRGQPDSLSQPIIWGVVEGATTIGTHNGIINGVVSFSEGLDTWNDVPSSDFEKMDDGRLVNVKTLRDGDRVLPDYAEELGWSDYAQWLAERLWQPEVPVEPPVKGWKDFTKPHR